MLNELSMIPFNIFYFYMIKDDIFTDYYINVLLIVLEVPADLSLKLGR